MSSSPNKSTVDEMLGLGESEADAPTGPVKKKFPSSQDIPENTPRATRGKKAGKKEEEEPEKKHPFTSTITGENKRRLASYQANKPGRHGSATTDVLNAALKMFFDDKKNRQYADADNPEGEK